MWSNDSGQSHDYVEIQKIREPCSPTHCSHKQIVEEPRILEAYKSLGSHEYFMQVLDTGMEKLRSEIFDKLEPLTVGLSSSIIVERMKTPDWIGLLHYLKRPSREP